MAATERAVTLATAAATAADAISATDITLIDVSERLPLTDAFVIASGSSERQVMAIAREVEDQLLEHHGAKALRREGREDGRWVLLDFSDIVVHVFHAEERTYYQLERLWRDCPELPFTPAEQPGRE